MATKLAIIEDDLAIGQMYRRKFESLGYSVQLADNGEIGLQMVEQFQPEILLLDLMMPLMNGDEVLKQVRAHEWGKKVNVIILTNMGKEEAPDTLKGLNVTDYIVKAEMTPKQVADTVINAFGKPKP